MDFVVKHWQSGMPRKHSGGFFPFSFDFTSPTAKNVKLVCETHLQNLSRFLVILMIMKNKFSASTHDNNR